MIHMEARARINAGEQPQHLQGDWGRLPKYKSQHQGRTTGWAAGIRSAGLGPLPSGIYEYLSRFQPFSIRALATLKTIHQSAQFSVAITELGGKDSKLWGDITLGENLVQSPLKPGNIC